MDDAWRALASATRRDILRLVHERERTAGDIAAAFSITRPAVSQHLTSLKTAGLLEERREGTKRLYRLKSDALFGLRDYLLGLSPLTEAEARPAAPASTSAGATARGWDRSPPRLEPLARGWARGGEDDR